MDPILIEDDDEEEEEEEKDSEDVEEGYLTQDDQPQTECKSNASSEKKERILFSSRSDSQTRAIFQEKNASKNNNSKPNNKNGRHHSNGDDVNSIPANTKHDSISYDEDEDFWNSIDFAEMERQALAKQLTSDPNLGPQSKKKDFLFDSIFLSLGCRGRPGV